MTAKERKSLFERITKANIALHPCNLDIVRPENENSKYWISDNELIDLEKTYCEKQTKK